MAERECDDTRELALLLPFYVNGTLRAGDRARVDRALKADPALRAELSLVRELRALVRDPPGSPRR
jgi:anti-sigma factor RsiW